MRRFGFVLVLVAAVAAPALADPATDAVKSGLVAFSKLTTYHATIETAGRTIELDSVAPGKLHVTTGGIEAIVLPGALYVKPQGNWMKIPAAAAGIMTGSFMGAVDRARAAVDQQTFTATDLGMKTAGGAALHAYSVKSKDLAKPSTMYFAGNGMLARVESADDKGGVTTIAFSKYNAPITVEAPM